MGLRGEGFLDSATTEQLADRVGYSSRHLVRLFQEHIGATPDYMARSRRAHLARRLLDETDLPISRIAFASGFLSIRQMNRVMLELFGFSPSTLRQKRRRGDVLEPLDGGLRLRLPYTGKLDGRRMTRYLGVRAVPGVEAVVDGVYRRTMVTCGFPGVVDVRDPQDEQHLEVSMHLPTFGSVVDQVDRVRSLFGLVQSQQVTVAGASTITGRLAERFGQTIEADLPSGPRSLFPSPEALAEADLREIGVPAARARTIAAFSRAVASGEIDLARVAPLEEARAALEEIPGIGPWSSNLIAARAMGHPDAFASSDLGLRKRAARLLGKSAPLSTRYLETVAEAWKPHRTTAMANLWMSRSGVERTVS